MVSIFFSGELTDLEKESPKKEMSNYSLRFKVTKKFRGLKKGQQTFTHSQKKLSGNLRCDCAPLMPYSKRFYEVTPGKIYYVLVFKYEGKPQIFSLFEKNQTTDKFMQEVSL